MFGVVRNGGIEMGPTIARSVCPSDLPYPSRFSLEMVRRVACLASEPHARSLKRGQGQERHGLQCPTTHELPARPTTILWPQEAAQVWAVCTWRWVMAAVVVGVGPMADLQYRGRPLNS